MNVNRHPFGDIALEANASARLQVVGAPSLIAGFEGDTAQTLIGVARSAIVEPVMPDSLRRP